MRFAHLYWQNGTKHTNSRLVFLGDEVLVVLGERKVEVRGGVGGAAEHMLAVTHAVLRQLVLTAEGGGVLELADAALILCCKPKI